MQVQNNNQRPQVIYNVRSIYMTGNVVVWEDNTVSYTVKGTCCSLIISPDGPKMLDKGSSSITPLEEANPLNKAEVYTLSIL